MKFRRILHAYRRIRIVPSAHRRVLR